MSVGPLSNKEFASYQEAIKRRESSSNYRAVNSLGYSGAYQMGAAALVDTGLVDTKAYLQAQRSGRFNQKEFLENPRNWTIPGGQQAFLTDPNLQDATFQNYTQANYSTLKRIGVLNGNEDPARVGGLLATSHLLGPGQAKKLANGQVTTTDANGTTAFEYYKLGSDSIKDPVRVPDAGAGVVSKDTKPNDPDRLNATTNKNALSAEDANRVKQDATTRKNQNASQQGKQANGNASNEQIKQRTPSAQLQDDPNLATPVIKTSPSKTATSDALPPTIDINPQPNILNNFASYTYNIALYMMSPKTYVKLMQKPRSVAEFPKILIARSGGVGSDAGPEFKEEFYIDDLELKNIGSSPNTGTGNTNAIDISFTVTEPRGVTFIERLRETAKGSLENEVDFFQAPYLLEIKFKGYDDLGKPVKEIVYPKYIPVKLIEFKFDVESTGAVYKIKACPFHQDLLKSIEQSIPINMQCKAKTVEDIFTKAQAEVEDAPIDVDDIDIDSTVYSDPGSLASAINNFYKDATKPKKILENVSEKDKKETPATDELADQISFYIEPSLAKAKLVQKNFDAMNTPNDDPNRLFKNYGAAIKGDVNLDSKTGTFKINSGTGIVNLINYIIVGSDYIEQNIIEENQIITEVDEVSGERFVRKENEPSTNEAIRWFKIKPKYTDTIGWDKKRGKYKFKVRYDIVPSLQYYSDFAWSKKAKPKGLGVHKVYDYIFTGLNTDVIDFKLSMDNAYYQTVALTSGNPRPDKTPNSSLGNPQTKVVTQSPSGQSIKDDGTIKNKRAKDLFSTLMNDGSDLINLNLSIRGDPAFLPTGDSFWQDKELNRQRYVEPYLPDGTIDYDLTPPYIQINLKTPTEYDDQSGLLIPNKGKYRSSEFNGVYQVTEITSTFSMGVFQQKLNGFRTHLQPDKLGDLSRDGVDQAEPKASTEPTRTISTSATTAPKLPNKNGSVNTFASGVANQVAGGNTLGEFATGKEILTFSKTTANSVAGGNTQTGEFGTLPNRTINPTQALRSEVPPPPPPSFSGLLVEDDAF